MADYSIWVLEYAYVPDYPRSSVLYGAHNTGTVKLPYAYVVLKSADRVAMIDVGYNYAAYGKQLADRFGVVNWHDPATVLAEIGVSPAEVTDILVTHAHFDHFGNTDAFPHATFYLQRRELEKWLWSLTLPPQFSSLNVATDPDDVLRAAGLALDGRLRLIDGDTEAVLPGVDLFAAPDTHTFGSQFVRVGNGDGGDPWIFAGDLRYVFENITGIDDDGVYVPVGLASGSQLNLLTTTDRMMQLVDGEERRIIPIHEARLGRVFPSRTTTAGLQVVEITRAPGAVSRVEN